MTSKSMSCYRCHLKKDSSEFNKSNTTKRGFQTACRDCEQSDNFRFRNYNRKRRFGMTPDDFIDLLKSQNGLCAICGTDEPGRNRNWCVDHDHSCCPGRETCGKCVRGLLCSDCNSKKLPVLENVEWMTAAIQYLEKWKR